MSEYFTASLNLGVENHAQVTDVRAGRTRDDQITEHRKKPVGIVAPLKIQRLASKRKRALQRVWGVLHKGWPLVPKSNLLPTCAIRPRFYSCYSRLVDKSGQPI